jgi:hypothetical protein
MQGTPEPKAASPKHGWVFCPSEFAAAPGSTSVYNNPANPPEVSELNGPPTIPGSALIVQLPWRPGPLKAVKSIRRLADWHNSVESLSMNLTWIFTGLQD